MKSILIVLFTLSGATKTVGAADLEVTPCTKNPEALYVSIKGQSANNLFRVFAKRIGLAPVDMVNTESNGFNCQGIKFSQDGDVEEAKCSFVMIGQNNIPYPQFDPLYSGEPIIECN